MNTGCYLGIDPGQKGGFAIIGPQGHLMVLADMPVTPGDIYASLRDGHQCYKIKFALVEQVGAFPGQGVSSMFKFGRHYGLLEMALIALHIPYDTVLPRVWQKAMSITPRKKKKPQEGVAYHTESKAQFKNRIKAKAQRLFPGHVITLQTADALLIAEHCRRTRK